jgi:hypothetical protein
VILNAFPLQQLLHERASLLRYTYIVYHVGIKPLNLYRTLCCEAYVTILLVAFWTKCAKANKINYMAGLKL